MLLRALLVASLLRVLLEFTIHPSLNATEQIILMIGLFGLSTFLYLLGIGGQRLGEIYDEFFKREIQAVDLGVVAWVFILSTASALLYLLSKL